MAYVIPRTVPGWEEFFEQAAVQRELEQIQAFYDTVYDDEGRVMYYPAASQVFRALELTPIAQARGVLLGQDPYHNGAATGLCFDVLPGCAVNPSLRNIYQELQNEGYALQRRDGVLTHWATQGILMLNSAFSVEKSNANAHAELWKKFTNLLMLFISRHPVASRLQWLLLGAHAQKMAASITTGTKHSTSHPSPYSADRGFLGSGIFRTAFGDTIQW